MKRGQEKSNLQSEDHSSERQPKSCLRDRMERHKRSRPEGRRRRKVRFEGIPENESVGSSSSEIDDQPRTNWLVTAFLIILMSSLLFCQQVSNTFFYLARKEEQSEYACSNSRLVKFLGPSQSNLQYEEANFGQITGEEIQRPC